MNFYYRDHLDISINQQGGLEDSERNQKRPKPQEGDRVDSNSETAVPEGKSRLSVFLNICQTILSRESGSHQKNSS